MNKKEKCPKNLDQYRGENAKLTKKRKNGEIFNTSHFFAGAIRSRATHYVRKEVNQRQKEDKDTLKNFLYP